MDADLEPIYELLCERIAARPELFGLNVPLLARPSVRLAAERVPYAKIDVGASRVGGLPDVPSRFEWPRWAPVKQREDRHGNPYYPTGPTPLGFIAQIDLSAIPQIYTGLPNSGWLYFFYDRFCQPWGYDPADRGCCRVAYADCERSGLVRTNPPNDADPEHTARPCLFEARPELTLPTQFPFESLDNTPAFKAYCDLTEDLERGLGSIHHRLFGYPQCIQDAMELECQLASNGVYLGDSFGYRSKRAKRLESGACDWHLLLQIDSDEDGPGWMWGDAGRIYFWIKRQDLAALRFDDVWLVLQC